ncbi:hypothetical protein [Crenobacter caeni]|uniref:Uncharacterized protein n=1 Tax=Crenobacter caeni TaxID=2705474 RepID=A0A6B2KNU4_9NEIS|nr:hypothetical protein [Crenobacter caeni]NDV11649.1 hypothetical protein [Crenobacter caeni]
MRLISDVLRDVRHGELIEDATTAMAELVKLVDETGKPGKLTIELTVKPASKGTGTMVVSDKMTIKKPELPRGETIMFGTPEGSLQLSDPRQKTIEFKTVPNAPQGESAPLKKVS